MRVNYSSGSLTREQIDFITENHYSRSARSLLQKHIFSLVDNRNNLIGIAVYGLPISRNTPANMLELRRFCLAPGAEKNTASQFLAHTLRWLHKVEREFDTVVTFADPNQGHKGTIYKAANFYYDGLEKSNPRVVMVGDRPVHLRQFYQKKDGQYTKNALYYQGLVASGEARIIQQERKLRFIYKLR